MPKPKMKKAKGKKAKAFGRRMMGGAPTPKHAIIKGMQKYGM